MDVKPQNFQSMLQFENLSEFGRSIVDNYLSGLNSILSNNKEKLITSLYASLEDAKPEVIDILKTYIVNLGEVFSEKELLALKKEAKAVIRYCRERKEQDLGFTRNSDNHPLMMPGSLLELCNSVMDVSENSSVFLPFAASAQFAFSNPTCRFDGFEPNPESWAFSQIYLQCFDIDANIQRTEDIFDSLHSGKEYDYIFSFPPFLQGKEGRKVIDSLYHLATKSLKEGGTMSCVLPMSFCSASSGWIDLRKILLDYKGQYSAAVISLPKMLYPYTSIETCLFILSKDKQGRIMLMDATSSNFCARHDVAGSKEFELKVQSVIESITKGDEKYVWCGTSTDLMGDVNLQPSRYLVSQILPEPGKDEHQVRLADIVKPVPLVRDEKLRSLVTLRNKIAHPSHYPSLDMSQEEQDSIMRQYREIEANSYPIIGMKELSSSYLNCDIYRDDLVSSHKVEYQMILTSDCLLIGFIGGKFKVGRIHGVSPKTPVVLRNEIFPVNIAANDISEDFFLRCIMSEPVQQQAQMLATGSTITRLSEKDFKSIVINVPNSKDRQDTLLKEDTRSSLTEADRKMLESFEDFRKDMHMVSHAIGQTLFNLKNWWYILQRARKEGNGIVSDDAFTGKIQKIAVPSIYDNIDIIIKQLKQQVSRFDRGNGLTKKRFALTEFIEDYIERKQSPIFSFIYDKTLHHASQTLYDVEFNDISGESHMTDEIILKEGDPLEYVDFAPEALEIVFDNIVSNACCHGFEDSFDQPNFIKIELLSEGDNYVIVISNNGAALNTQIKPSAVFIYGRTSKMGKVSKNGDTHFGIGGYEIQKLMREFGGDASLITDANADFPFAYKLTFYNTNIEESIEL